MILLNPWGRNIFIDQQPIDKDLKIIYNELYEKEKNTNKFIVPEGLSGEQGL
jgi:hypothetical protein